MNRRISPLCKYVFEYVWPFRYQRRLLLGTKPRLGIIYLFITNLLHRFSQQGFSSFPKGEDEMKAHMIVAIILIAAGILGLVYTHFTYTKDTHEASLGPINLSVKEKETVYVPTWAGVVCIAVGASMLLFKGYFMQIRD